MRFLSILACSLFLGIALNHSSANLNISFDDSKNTDTTGLLDAGSTGLACLNQAASFFEGIITDDLDAIVPGGGNNWTVSFSDPSSSASTPAMLTVTDPTVAADTITMFIGAASLPGSTLGRAGPGGYSAGGTTGWVDTIRNRGETGTTIGASADEFAPWGGSLSMDNATSWDFGNPGACDVVADNTKSHFYSVALHELGHALGLGTADSWDAMVVTAGDGINFEFTGTDSVAANGGANVPLSGVDSLGNAVPGDGHWKVGTSSTVWGTSTVQEAAMDPNLTVGTRKLFTTLDVAGLQDVGWSVTAIPEPTSFAYGGLIFAFSLISCVWKHLTSCFACRRRSSTN